MTETEHEDRQLLAKLLWLNHGCPMPALYGDDGEMQCNRCLIDFKRMSAAEIDRRLIEVRLRRDIEVQAALDRVGKMLDEMRIERESKAKEQK